MTKSRPPLAGVTRKHLARADREAIMTKWITGVTIGVTVIVVALLAYGWLDSNVLQMRRPVAQVGDVEISTERFQKAVKYSRMQLIEQYIQMVNYIQIAQAFGADPQTLNFYQQQASQVEAQLEQPQSLGRQVLDSLIDEELIRQEAARRGITVSAEEIDRAMQEAFNFYKDGTPTPVPTSTLAPTQPPTATPEPSATPTGAPTTEPSATPTATAPSPTPTQGPSATPRPTSTPYTFEGYLERKDDYIQDLSANTGMTEADFRAIVELNLLREKLQPIIAVDATSMIKTAHVRHILISIEPGKEAEAQAEAADLIAQLQAGADFAELAAAHSDDPGTKDNGGDLGTRDDGHYVAPFNAVAFNEPPGLYPEPVQTEFGYHIIDILEQGQRDLSEAEVEQNQATAFSEWLRTQRTNLTLVQEFEWQLLVPNRPTVQDVIDSRPTATPPPATATSAATPSPAP